MQLIIALVGNPQMLEAGLNFLKGLCQICGVSVEDESTEEGVALIIPDYDEVSDEFSRQLTVALGQLLLSAAKNGCGVTVSTNTIRTAGFGEDGPRWTNENGVTVDHRPWERP